jgi:hypothetical protein
MYLHTCRNILIRLSTNSKPLLNNLSDASQTTPPPHFLNSSRKTEIGKLEGGRVVPLGREKDLAVSWKLIDAIAGEKKGMVVISGRILMMKKKKKEESV